MKALTPNFLNLKRIDPKMKCHVTCLDNAQNIPNKNYTADNVLN